MTYAERIAKWHEIANRPSHIPYTPAGGPAVVAWYESLDRKPSTIELLDMIAQAVADIAQVSGPSGCRTCGWSGPTSKRGDHFRVDPATQQYVCGGAE